MAASSTHSRPDTSSPEGKASIWTSAWGVFALATLCCFLWGSAFPAIKVGYRLFSIAGDDMASQMLFAGVRFLLAGVGVITVMSLVRKSPLVPKPADAGPILVLSLFQTTVQYLFFYLGLAHASGVSSAIIEASNPFFALLIAALAFRRERLTPRKVLGSAIGFAGVILTSVMGGGGFGFTLAGEGAILLSTISAAISTSLISVFSDRHDPVLLSGWQFAAGGLTLMAVGALMGGHLAPDGPTGVILLLYLAFVSACAYSVWSVLLSRNPVSRVTVYGFANPVFGTILSALVLGEGGLFSPVVVIFALVLVSVGTVIVNTADS